MKIIIITALVVFGCLVLTVESNLQTNLSQDDKGRVPPEVIELAQEAKLGKVTFNHGNHITKNFSIDGTARLTCTECHHVEQPASETVKTAHPADRTATLTAESLKDPITPLVTSCRDCHVRKGDDPALLDKIPQIENEKTGKPIILTNQNAFHRTCTACHSEVVKARPKVKAPTAMKCTTCHKRA